MTTTRHQVASVDDLDDGEMIQVEVEDLDLLVVCLDGDYYATGGRCSHYGAPLANGVLEEETGCVVCPWHHSVFQIATGEMVEPPGIDHLTQFEVTVEEGDIYVDIPEGASGMQEPDFCPYDEANRRHVVIVGGGAAGFVAVETLRRYDFDGRITVVTADTHLPYDRPKLSKSYLAGDADEKWLPLRKPSFYEDLDIEVRRGQSADGLRPDDQVVELEDGSELEYDDLLLATGGRPRQLPVSGTDLGGVHLLRTRADCDAIIEDAERASEVVIIGSSFIGMEAAASFRSRELDVTVTSMDAEPFEKAFGRPVGRSFRQLHREYGVSFELETGIDRLEGDDAVGRVVLEDGTELPADLVLVGIGVTPATSFVEGLDMADDGSIEVDRRMQARPNVYAAGDIARFPDPRTMRRIRVEHWRLAAQLGKVAALNMVGEETEYDEVPFFWTRQYGTSYKYVGHADRWEDVIIHGDLDERDYIAYYVDGDDVLAAVGTRGDDLTRFHAMMRHDEEPTTDELVGGFEFS